MTSYATRRLSCEYLLEVSGLVTGFANSMQCLLPLLCVDNARVSDAIFKPIDSLRNATATDNMHECTPRRFESVASCENGSHALRVDSRQQGP